MITAADKSGCFVVVNKEYHGRMGKKFLNNGTNWIVVPDNGFENYLAESTI